MTTLFTIQPSRPETQKQKIRRHLESGMKITPMQALSSYGCFRLAARIKELRNEGMNIVPEIRRKGRKQWAVYSKG